MPGPARLHEIALGHFQGSDLDKKLGRLPGLATPHGADKEPEEKKAHSNPVSVGKS